MATLTKGSLILGASVLLTLGVTSAFSQSVADHTVASPASYGGPQHKGVLPQEDALPEQSAPSFPTVSSTPNEEQSVPLQRTLLSSKTVVGAVVNNAQGEQVGTIRELMVDPHSGQVVYAVVDSVRTFGLGKQKSLAMPWRELHVKLNQTEIVVELYQQQSQAVPAVALKK
jgi:sporulation protein YlmC with PRC-barrel domain